MPHAHAQPKVTYCRGQGQYYSSKHIQYNYTKHEVEGLVEKVRFA